MNQKNKKALATKIINRANSATGEESFGFKRYAALTVKMSRNLALSHYVSGKEDNTFIQTTVKFFKEMTENEYRSWLIISA